MSKLSLKKLQTKVWYKPFSCVVGAGVAALLVFGSVKAAGLSADRTKLKAEEKVSESSIVEAYSGTDPTQINELKKESSVNKEGVRVALSDSSTTLDENGNVIDGQGRIICYADGTLGEGMYIDENGNVIDSEGNIVYSTDASSEGTVKDFSNSALYSDMETLADNFQVRDRKSVV